MEVNAIHNVTGEKRTFTKMVWDSLPITRINGVIYPKMGYVLKKAVDVSIPKEVNEPLVPKEVNKPLVAEKITK